MGVTIVPPLAREDQRTIVSCLTGTGQQRTFEPQVPELRWGVSYMLRPWHIKLMPWLIGYGVRTGMVAGDQR